MPADFRRRRLEDHKSFYCPSGHGQSYTGKSDVEKERERAAAAERKAEDWKGYAKDREEALDRERKSHASTKGQLTKTKKRVPFDFIDRVFAVMALTPQHTYQVLTKRPARMREYFDQSRWAAVEVALSFMGHSHVRRRPEYGDWPLLNVWLGCTVENQHFADERIPILLDTPAAVRFISAEPLLGPVDLGLNRWVRIAQPIRSSWMAAERRLVEPGVYRANSNPFGALSINRLGIMPGEFERLPNPDWVICGGESGSKHRRFDPEWALNLRLQCQGTTAFFMKQIGGNRPGNKLEDLPPDLQVREFPEVTHD
jgi:protein gp37